MKDAAAHELNVKMTQTHDTFGGLPNNGKSFRQEIIERFSLGQAQTELIRLGAQTGITKTRNFRFQRIDFIYIALAHLQFFFIGVTKDHFH